MTETRPEAEVGTAPVEAPVAVPDPPGLAGWLATSDHKRIGRLWLAASLLFLLVGGVVGMVLAVERLDTGLDVLNDDTFAQVYGLHGEVAVFLVLVPLFLGLATFVVPLQVGSYDIAFPRGAATALWTYVLGGALLLAAYIADGGQAGGSDVAVDLWYLALGLVLVATVLALICVLTTVLTLRAPGMTLRRTPIFSWSVLVGGGLTLLTTPVLLARLVELFITHHHGGEVGGGPVGDGSAIAWFWSVPHVYLLVVVAAGVAVEVVPPLSGVRLRQHEAAMVLIGLLGVLGIGAWAQRSETFDDLLYVAVGLAVVVPILALLGLVGDGVRRGRLSLAAPLLLGLGTLVLLFLGAVAGAALVIDPLDLRGTVWEAGHVHLVLLGGGLLGALAGLWWWAPKIWGAPLADGAGKAAAALVLFGAVLLAAPDLVNGLVDDVALADPHMGDDGLTTAMNAVSAVGGALVVLGALVVVGAVLALAGGRRQEPTANDPWGAWTLEWSTTSPPPLGNFAEPVPAVTSPTPLLDGDPAPEAEVSNAEVTG